MALVPKLLLVISLPAPVLFAVRGACLSLRSTLPLITSRFQSVFSFFYHSPTLNAADLPIDIDPSSISKPLAGIFYAHRYHHLQTLVAHSVDLLHHLFL